MKGRGWLMSTKKNVWGTKPCYDSLEKSSQKRPRPMPVGLWVFATPRARAVLAMPKAVKAPKCWATVPM